MLYAFRVCALSGVAMAPWLARSAAAAWPLLPWASPNDASDNGVTCAHDSVSVPPPQAVYGTGPGVAWAACTASAGCFAPAPTLEPPAPSSAPTPGLPADGFAPEPTPFAGTSGGEPPPDPGPPLRDLPARDLESTLIRSSSGDGNGFFLPSGNGAARCANA